MPPPKNYFTILYNILKRFSRSFFKKVLKIRKKSIIIRHRSKFELSKEVFMSTIIGRITKGVGGLYFVDCGKESSLPCRARGKFRRSGECPQIGDLVKVELADGSENIICEILPRKNLLIRPPMANLDDLFIVLPTTSPNPDLQTIDKLSAIAVHDGITPYIVISKCALDPVAAEGYAEIYKKSGIPTIVTDAVCGIGIDELRETLYKRAGGRIAAFAGASGVGKSTLLNALYPKLSLETGSVSEKTERGRHTTRKVELFCAKGGYIADTPGFTMLDFVHFDFMDKDELRSAFPEFLPYIGDCKYRKCSHTKEEGCAIIDAVRSGIIAKSRHNSYVSIYEDLKGKHDWDKKR